jgi:hypothetical protein
MSGYFSYINGVEGGIETRSLETPAENTSSKKNKKLLHSDQLLSIVFLTIMYKWEQVYCTSCTVGHCVSALEKIKNTFLYSKLKKAIQCCRYSLRKISTYNPTVL